MRPKAPRPLQRVHRNLSKPKIEELRESVAALVPASRAQVGELVRDMRLSTKRSQAEYAALCSVSLRVLRQVESGKLNLQTATIEKLLRPFGYRIGVVRDDD